MIMERYRKTFRKNFFCSILLIGEKATGFNYTLASCKQDNCVDVKDLIIKRKTSGRSWNNRPIFDGCNSMSIVVLMIDILQKSRNSHRNLGSYYTQKIILLKCYFSRMKKRGIFWKTCLWNRDAARQRCCVKKMFLEILQTLEENTCARISFSI